MLEVWYEESSNNYIIYKMANDIVLFTFYFKKREVFPIVR